MSAPVCPVPEEILHRLLDERADDVSAPATRATGEAAAHVGACPACGERLDALRRLRRALIGATVELNGTADAATTRSKVLERCAARAALALADAVHDLACATARACADGPTPRIPRIHADVVTLNARLSLVGRAIDVSSLPERRSEGPARADDVDACLVCLEALEGRTARWRRLRETVAGLR